MSELFDNIEKSSIDEEGEGVVFYLISEDLNKI